MLKIITLLMLGLFLYSFVLNQSLPFYVDERLVLLVMISGLGLILAGLSYTRRVPSSAEPASNSPSASGRRFHWSFLWLLWVPVVAGFFYVPMAVNESNTAVLYLAQDSQDHQQLYKIIPGQFTPQQLTTAAQDVLDYAPAPDGQSIVYTLENESGSSDIWLIDPDGRLPYQLLDCDGDVCRNPTWTPDGRRLLYDRGFNLGPGQLAVNQRLFWLDVASQTTTPVFSDPTIIGSTPRLSPNGEWLSYLVPDAGLPVIQLYHLPTNSGRQVVSETGENGVFHPVVNSFFFTDIKPQGESVSIHIFEDNLNAPPGTLYNRTGELALVNDGGLSWSPTGSRLAFTRNPARTPTGRQIWLMAPDGSEQRSLTDEPHIHHGPPQWSPNGRVLLFQRFDTTRPQEPPSIWTLNLGTDELRQVTPTGIQPRWVGSRKP